MLKSFLDYAKTSRKQRFEYMDIIYAKYKTPKEIGAIVGIGSDTVRKVLKENGIHIRKSWEYPKE